MHHVILLGLAKVLNFAGKRSLWTFVSLSVGASFQRHPNGYLRENLGMGIPQEMNPWPMSHLLRKDNLFPDTSTYDNTLQTATRIHNSEL